MSDVLLIRANSAIILLSVLRKKHAQMVLNLKQCTLFLSIKRRDLCEQDLPSSKESKRKMISVPFESAHIVAVLFVFSELVLLPLVERTTTSLAYLFLVQHTRNGNTIQVSPLRSPVFSDGLLSKSTSHLMMLLIRLIAAGILVYAETTLVTTQPLETEPRIVDTAFDVAPRSDYLKYEEEANLTTSQLRDYAALTFDRCTKRDSEGWVVANSANVTTNTKRTIYAKPICLLSTGRRVYREIDESRAFTVGNTIQYPTLAKRFSLEVTWIVKPFELFPDTTDRNRYKPGDELMEIMGVMDLDSQLTCSSISRLKRWNASSQNFGFDVTCQNGTGKIVEFFSAVKNGNGENVKLDPDKNGSKRQLHNRTLYKAVGNYSLIPLGKFEFEKPLLFDAAHIMQGDCFSSSGSLRTKSDLSTRVRRLLYTQVRNETFYIYTGLRKVKTEVPLVFLLIVSLEILFVFLATFAVQFWMGRKRKEPKPNTLGGLSRLWKINEGCESESGGIDLYMAVKKDASRRTYYFSPHNLVARNEIHN